MARSSGPAWPPSTARSAGSARSGSPRTGVGDGARPAPDRGVIDAAEAAGCRDARPRRDRRRADRCTNASASRSRRGTVTLEAPGRGRARPGPDPRIRAFRPADLAPMAALDATADRRGPAPPAGGLRGAGRDPRRSSARTGLRGFVIRAPWGGGATIAPDPDDALALLEARRDGAGPARRVRAGVLARATEAGLGVLARAGWTEAWRAPRLVRGAALTGIRPRSGASSTTPWAERTRVRPLVGMTRWRPATHADGGMVPAGPRRRHPHDRGPNLRRPDRPRVPPVRDPGRAAGRHVLPALRTALRRPAARRRRAAGLPGLLPDRR